MYLSYEEMMYIILDIWAPKYSNHFLVSTSHINAFMAACMISDKLI
jgi:hypothetical protein